MIEFDLIDRIHPMLVQFDLNNLMSLDTLNNLLKAQNFDMPAGFDPCSSDLGEDTEEVNETIGLDSMAN